MKRKFIFACALLTAFALTNPANSGGKPPELTFAETWDDGLAEAAARNVPVLFLWPQRG